MSGPGYWPLYVRSSALTPPTVSAAAWAEIVPERTPFSYVVPCSGRGSMRRAPGGGSSGVPLLDPPQPPPQPPPPERLPAAAVATPPAPAKPARAA